VLFHHFLELGRVRVGHGVLIGEMPEGEVGFLSFLQALQRDVQGEPGFGVGSDYALDSVEFGLKGAEETEKVEGPELGGEAVHGFVMQYFRLAVAEEAPVMAADLLSFEGNLTAEISVGQVVLAEIGGLGHVDWLLFSLQK
jgi:hypothetical protein